MLIIVSFFDLCFILFCVVVFRMLLWFSHIFVISLCYVQHVVSAHVGALCMSLSCVYAVPV